MGKKIPKAVNHGGRKKPQAVSASISPAQPPRSAARLVKSPIRLTISLMVSNRIDTVRKCLSSLKPLLDALPSELIVVDTVGPERSDGSLAVAREFTDKIVRFEWCGDFAAARNAGLERARGEWFLFLDDDEWFEDVSEIINFLKTEDGRYNTCLYRVRNYKDRGGRNYTDGYAERLVRRSDQLRFEDRIHERLVGTMGDLKTLDAFVHHYGYVFDSQEDFERHSLRNLNSLEKLLEERPGYLRAVVHLAQEYLRCREYEKAEALCRETLDGEGQPGNPNYISVTAYFYVNVLVSLKKWEEVRAQAERLLKRPGITELAKASICHRLNDCAYAFDSERMLSNADEYFRLLDILDADPDKLATQQILSLGVCESEPNRAILMECALKRAIDIGDEGRVWAYIRRAAKNPGENNLILEKCVPLMAPYAAEKDSFEALYALIEPHLKKESSLSCLVTSVRSCLEPVALFKSQVRLIDFLNGLQLDRPYFVLLKIRAAEKARDMKKLAELFDRYFGLEGADFAHELMQIAHRNGLDISRCAGKIDIDQWDRDMRLLADSCPTDQARGILGYLKGCFPENSPEVLSLEAALALKALREDRSQDVAARSGALREYIRRLYAFYLALGNAGNFTAERCHYLSAGGRAAFYLKQSVDLGDGGDFASQARMLKMALSLKSDLVDFVKIMMKDIEVQIERKKAEPAVEVNAEFLALAARLKGVVAEFILKGDMRNARNVLDQLNQILPGDPDIPKLYMQLYQ
jgi:glycosyltransferase involved in cell wall biosynthesis